MEKLLIDENGEYGLDCTQAVWASDKMHEDYHRAKVQLSDADFLLEEVNNILIVEYKNADTKKAREARYRRSIQWTIKNLLQQYESFMIRFIIYIYWEKINL